jgi:hypothetical protein
MIVIVTVYSVFVAKDVVTVFELLRDECDIDMLARRSDHKFLSVCFKLFVHTLYVSGE